MVKIVCLLSFFILLLCSGEAQKPVKFSALQDSAGNGMALSVLVDTESLEKVSRSVLTAESWLRDHVLSFYPEVNVSVILVGRGVFCSKNQHMMASVLPSIKNIQHSLSRWGLEKEIKVSVSFSTDCLNSRLISFRDDVANSYIKPLLAALQDTGSPYVVEPPPYLDAWSDEMQSLLKHHSKSIENLGVPHPIAMNVMNSQWTEEASVDAMSPISASPAPSLSASSTYFTSPPFPATDALPPSPRHVLSHSPVASPSASPLSSPMPPANHQANPPFGPHLPPCEPSHGSGSVASATHDGEWCVAKASVPFETLQKSLDFACGEGGVDCEAIEPGGSCYFPDNIVAHASYAFNIYWQRHKRNGGTCGFGDTAMLITSNPSYGHCTYLLT